MADILLADTYIIAAVSLFVKLKFFILKGGFHLTLKELREAAGLKQPYVARKLYVSQNAVSQWERGANGIASKFVPKLAKLYHVTDEEIIAAIRAAQEARAGETA